MRLFIILLIGLLIQLPSEVLSQAAITLYMPKADKKAGYHKTQSFKKEKEEAFRWSAMEAVIWLEKEAKPKKKKKAYEQLVKVLPKAVTNSEAKLAELEQAVSTFTGPQTVNDLIRIKNILTELRFLDEKIRALPPEWAVKAFKENDREEHLAQIKEALKAAKWKAAELFYHKGDSLESSGGNLDRLGYIPVAKVFGRSWGYAPDYKDVKDRYAVAKQKATCRFILASIKNRTNYSNATTAALLKEVEGSVRKDLKRKGYPYFELVFSDRRDNPDRYNVKMEVEITKALIRVKDNEPTEKARKRGYEEKGGKTVEYEGTYIINSQEAIVTLEFQYKITDMEKNEVLHSSQVAATVQTWNDYWYTYKGNIKALKDSEQEQVRKDKVRQRPPADKTLAQMSFNGSSSIRELKELIMKFAVEHGGR